MAVLMAPIGSGVSFYINDGYKYFHKVKISREKIICKKIFLVKKIPILKKNAFFACLTPQIKFSKKNKKIFFFRVKYLEKNYF